MNDDRRVGREVAELLQTMIRNRCVNDGTRESGNESRNASALAEYLDGSGLDVELYEDIPGRASVVTRLDGADPMAPTLLLLGHTDVVPVNEANWSEDPFGGELKNGRIWGRGAIDMLNLTASMAVAVRRMATDPTLRPRGDVVFVGVADEESGGVHGAEFLLDQHADAVAADFVLTESGGIPMAMPTGRRMFAVVGEKGGADVRLRVRGTSGHASMPLGADNAVVTAARIVERIADAHIDPQLRPAWIEFVDGMGFDDELRSALEDPVQFDGAVGRLPGGLAPRAHACARMTAVPTVVHGGVKSNVIPDVVDLQVNVRPVMGQTQDDVLAFFDNVLAELRPLVEIDVRLFWEATETSTDTRLWSVLRDVARDLGGATLVPSLTAGGTDAHYFRKRGVPSYGFGCFSEQMTTESFFRMFHGDDEWVDQESLILSTEAWIQVALGL